MLAPNGQDWLTRASRGPQQVFRFQSPATEVSLIAKKYAAKASAKEAIVQDFHTVRQALNVASADQRVLVIVHGPKTKTDPLKESLKAVANDERVIGRFHFDFDETDKWQKTVSGLKLDSGIAVIRPSEFGMKGTVMSHLPLDTSNGEIIKSLLEANATFAKSTKKKVYSQHVEKGRQQGIYFEGAVEYGEDRDGDGKIDFRGPPRRRGPAR